MNELSSTSPGPASARPARLLKGVAWLLVASILGACVYRVDVQQGNLLEQNDIDTVQVGMTRNQVRFLLGTPVAGDSFYRDRWDYIYFFRQGRSKTADRRWLIVYFDEDIVREIQRDVPVKPS